MRWGSCVIAGGATVEYGDASAEEPPPPLVDLASAAAPQNPPGGRRADRGGVGAAGDAEAPGVAPRGDIVRFPNPSSLTRGGKTVRSRNDPEDLSIATLTSHRNATPLPHAVSIRERMISVRASDDDDDDESPIVVVVADLSPPPRR